MSIIHKYILKEIFKYFMVVMSSVCTIFLLVDFIERIDNFMETNLHFSRFIYYLILKIPFIIVQLLPISILLAIIVVFGIMIKNNEIVALKSSGISYYYLIKPVIISGIISTFILLIFSEILLPLTMGKANHIWYNEVKKKRDISANKTNIWIKGNKLISYISFYNPLTKTIFDVTLNFFDDNFKLIKRIDAKHGICIEKKYIDDNFNLINIITENNNKNKNNKWILYNLVLQEFDKKTNEWNVSYPEEYKIDLEFEPLELSKAMKKTDEMNIVELLEYIKKIEYEGYDARKFIVDMWAKTAFPFICFIMSILGVGMTAKRQTRKGQGIAGSIVMGIGVSFLYWVVHSVCLSLGYAGSLYPIIAAWITNIIFICFAGLLLINSD